MKRIAVVDDEASFRAFIRMCLKGYDVSAFESFEDFKSRRDGAFGLVLMDHYLPGTSGMDGLAMMRASGDMTPVCIVSGSLKGDLEARERANGYGVHILHKPFTFPALKSYIESALSGSV